MVSQYTPVFEDIVGATAFRAGKASTVSGISANGMRLRISLVAPSPDFTSRVAMGAFCAVPLQLPDRPAESAAGERRAVTTSLPISRAVCPAQAEHALRRCAAASSGRARDLVDDRFAAPATCRCAAGQVDLDLSNVPRSAVPDLIKEFGVNKSRFFIHAFDETDVYVLNMSRPEFANANLRKAVNYAVSREALAEQTGLGGVTA